MGVRRGVIDMCRARWCLVSPSIVQYNANPSDRGRLRKLGLG